MVVLSNNNFIHLRLHSAYSLAEGALPIKLIPKLCKQNAMPAVAITDTANLFGALEFSLSCAEKGIQPIIGCQLNLYVEAISDFAPFLLLVKNEIGYANLLKLVSNSYLTERPTKFDKPVILLAELESHGEGLILLTGGHQGILAKVLSLGPEGASHFLQTLMGSFPGSLYIEIMRHGILEQQQMESKFLELALSHNLPVVATNDVFFESADLYGAHDTLLCIAEGRYISETNRKRVTPHHYFKSTLEMQNLFADLPEAIENTLIIARRCHFMPTERPPILPPYPTKNNIAEATELQIQAEQGLEKRLREEVFPRLAIKTSVDNEVDTVSGQQTVRDNYYKRLNYELGIINRMGFPGYFLIVADFIQWAKSQKIPVGPGRGSGAGSLVAWSLTITNMDPIHFNLIFERFLNPERISMPDFDIDFCQDRRDEVIDYVCRKYGKDRVAHIITFGKLQARAVLRDVGRVLQMPYSQVDRLCRLIPNNPANPVTLAQALELEPAIKEQARQDDTVQNLIDIGTKLEGLYRHASTHAAGVVIGDRPLVELVPLYKDDRSSLPATQFSMKYVEAAGLLKFDFLGLKTLTVIERCRQLITNKVGFADFDPNAIPLDDEKTFGLLCRVDVVGVFQVESGGMRDVLRKLKPDRLEDIIALVALFRPGPMDDIPRYLACKHGDKEVSYAHPDLKPILETTYGVMVYQEQVMQIAQVLGGYTLGNADLLRRAMGKKIKSEMDAQRDLFVNGAVNNGVDQVAAGQIFDQMAKFAGYGFNKSHSAPYALLTYQTAYLKANHPLEFFAATMTYDLDNTDKINVYQQDLDHLGIPLFPPDINKSLAVFSVESNGIRYALAALKNVGLQAMESLVKERQQNGIFKNIADFVQRFDGKAINKRQLEHLIAAGALDCLMKDDPTLTRSRLFQSVEFLLSQNNLKRHEVNTKQAFLFAPMTESFTLSLPNVVEWSPLEGLQREFEALGHYQSAHPLDIYYKLYQTPLQYLNLTNSKDLKIKVNAGQIFGNLSSGNSTLVNLVGVAITKQERASKNGQRFAFLSLSDSGGVFEVALFSEVYSQNRDLLQLGAILFITASVRVEGDNYRLTAQTVELLDDKLKGQPICLTIDHTFNVQKLHSFLELCPESPRESFQKSLTGNGSILRFTLTLPGLPTLELTLPGSYELNVERYSQLMQICS